MFERKKRVREVIDETSGSRRPEWANVLVVVSAVLSAASIIWTTYSVLDLLSIGVIAITLAATLDLVWISIQYAQHKAVPLMGYRRATEIAGWGALAAVVVLLVFHGLSLEGQVVAGQLVDQETAVIIAAASPLLPIGAKVVMMLAAARFCDPADLTPEDLDELAHRQREETKAHRLREIEGAERRSRHEDWLRQQEEERERARAVAREQREKDMANAEAEREKLRMEAQAELDALKAETERQIEAARLKAELEIAGINNRSEIEMLRATSGVEIDIRRVDLENDLRRRMPITIQGTVEERHELPPTPTPPRRRKKNEDSEQAAESGDDFYAVYPLETHDRDAPVPIDVTGLSPAQAEKKRLAAMFYRAQADNPALSKAAFARQLPEGKKVTPVEMSRATMAFPRENILQEQRRMLNSRNRKPATNDSPRNGERAS